MNFPTPETSTPRDVTTIRNFVTESALFLSEITVSADNVGAGLWQEMVDETVATGKEVGRGIFYDRIGRKFVPGELIVGHEAGIDESIPLPPPIKGFKRALLSLTTTVHTHPMTSAPLARTSIPSGADLRRFLFGVDGAMVTIDRGGAHLIIRTEAPRKDDLPSRDLVQERIDEVANRDGVIADVQRQFNGAISEYGATYFYTPHLSPAPDGTVTFRRP